MAAAKVKVPLQSEQIIERADKQTLRLARFFQGVSENLWGKKYIADTDGSEDFTISSDPAIVALTRGWIIPYQADDRIWLIDFCFVYTVASAVRTRVDLTLPLVFANTTGYFQPCIGQQVTAAPGAAACFCIPNEGTVTLFHDSETTDTYVFKGDSIELKAKPDWVE